MGPARRQHAHLRLVQPRPGRRGGALVRRGFRLGRLRPHVRDYCRRGGQVLGEQRYRSIRRRVDNEQLGRGAPDGLSQWCCRDGHARPASRVTPLMRLEPCPACPAPCPEASRADHLPRSSSVHCFRFQRPIQLGKPLHDAAIAMRDCMFLNRHFVAASTPQYATAQVADVSRKVASEPGQSAAFPTGNDRASPRKSAARRDAGSSLRRALELTRVSLQVLLTHRKMSRLVAPCPNGMSAISRLSSWSELRPRAICTDCGNAS